MRTSAALDCYLIWSAAACRRRGNRLVVWTAAHLCKNC